MNIEERKKILKTALINSFVDDSKAYKKTIEFINKDFVILNIDFQYSYDEFCIEFLNQTIKNIENIDIFNSDGSQFSINYWQFNLYVLQCMLNEKFIKLGYKYEDFYDQSNMKQKIDKKYLN